MLFLELVILKVKQYLMITKKGRSTGSYETIWIKEFQNWGLSLKKNIYFEERYTQVGGGAEGENLKQTPHWAQKPTWDLILQPMRSWSWPELKPQAGGLTGATQVPPKLRNLCDCGSRSQTQGLSERAVIWKWIMWQGHRIL